MDTASSTMTSELTVLLRAWPTLKSEEQDLPFLIARINDQKRSFRNVTEQSLEEEIRVLEARTAGEKEQESTDDFEVEEKRIDSKTRKEEVLTARNEILAQIAQAQLETAYALDFVSLLLSKHTPRQAESTISPFLKQQVPLGSLGAEVAQVPQISDSKRVDDDLVSTGWKMQSLDATADSLLRSATRLEKEVEQEARHWEEVLAIQAKGWSVSRLPRERHNLGVRYGFSEAAPEFRDRGLAALRRSEDGGVQLELGSNVSEPRNLRVRIQQRGHTITSSVGSNQVSVGEESSEDSILQARNSLYDEELFHEMYREARNLMNRGVRCTSDAILVPLDECSNIVIDLVPQDEDASTDDTVDGPPEMLSFYRVLPRAFALVSQILLSHAHRQNYNRRTHLPPPLTERKPARPVYWILRPLLGLLQQQAALKTMGTFLETLRIICDNAGLKFTLKIPTSVLGLLTQLDLKESLAIPLVEQLGNLISGPLQANYVVTLPSVSSQLQVHVRTYLMGPEYKVNVTAPSHSPLFNIPHEMLFGSSQEVQDYILHLLMLDLVAMIYAGNKKWKIMSLHEGQLSTDPSVDGQRQLLTLSVKQDMLMLQCRSITKAGEIEEVEVSWSPEFLGKQGLMDEVKTIGTK